MEPIMQIIGAWGGPTSIGSGLVILFLYFRKYDKEMRDEVRADNDSLRAERTELREQITEKDAEIERLKSDLWTARRGHHDGNPNAQG